MQDLLKGLRVIDMTTVVLGPYATQVLGDFGAEVIKVESLSGDVFRYVRPGRSQTMGAGYINCNRNKKSIALDLKSEQGRKVFNKLLETADVVVHNMRDKTASKLGASYEAVKKVNERIVYCSAPGYGQDGLYADEPAYDDIIQAASGIAHLNTDINGEPRFLPTIICDKVGGLHLALAVLGGIAHRLKTGKGCAVEAPMFESMVSFLMVEQLAGQSFSPPIGGTGYERLQSPYRRPFATADGYISVLPYTTKHWVGFLKLAGRDDLVSEDYVVNPVVRSENINNLYKIIAEVTPERTTDEWVAILRAADIPCSRVNSIADLLEDEHLKSVNFFTHYEHPSEGSMQGVRSPITVKGMTPSEDLPPPTLGEHTMDTVQRLGIPESQIDVMKREGNLR
ncbi:CaiB/BaiF CoA-transferase family protein [Marinimicrobium sp. LS-A18]|uniref:CaiB/BaiF CoA transferase family protein n=1 Tax=Marinimicrobium sp. LS-A18 TaxID=1381596 RepID=UPI0004B971F1|nr:CoA transferase [Marinimicrobium sp. LS-A18]